MSLLSRRPLAALGAISAAALIGVTGCSSSPSADGPIELTLFYPVAVGGPQTKIVDDLVAQCEAEMDDVSIEAVYSGSYSETMTRAQTAARSGNPPDLAVLLSIDLHTLVDNKLILPLDDFMKKESFVPEDYFFDAFLVNSRTAGKTWSLPFQRVTIVQFHNKDLFTAAGLDPEKPPTTWAEVSDASAKLTASGVSDFGIEIPSTSFGYWMLQAMAMQSGVEDTAGVDGVVDYLDDPGTVESLTWWKQLVDSGAMPPGTTEWASTPEDFIQGRTAMMWHTSSNLGNLRANADFDFGVSMLPANTNPGSPTGGGNLYVFDSGDDRREQAAYELSRCLTTPERAAQWSMATGYVAPAQEVWDLPEMKEYVAESPESVVALDQLEYATGETASHENGRVVQAINDAIAAVLAEGADPSSTLKELQQNIDTITARFR